MTYHALSDHLILHRKKPAVGVSRTDYLSITYVGIIAFAMRPKLYWKRPMDGRELIQTLGS